MWVTEPSSHPRDAEALAWVHAKVGSDFGGLRDFSDFGYAERSLPFAAAPLVAAPPPDVGIVRDSTADGIRRVRLRVRSRVGAEMIQLRYPEGGATRLLAMNGLAIAEPERLRWAEHWGEPNGAIALQLELPSDRPIELELIEHLLRPGELLGAELFTRPPHLAPNIVWLSDRAMLRSSVEALAEFRPGEPGGVRRP